MKIINKKNISNVLWLFTDKFLKVILGLVISFVVIKHLGPESFGYYNYYVNIGLIIFSVASLGLDGISIKEIINCDKNKDKIIGTTFILRMSVSLILLLIICAHGFFYGKNLYFLLFISIGNMFTGINVSTVYLQAYSKIKYIAYSGIITTVIVSSIKVYLVFFNKQLSWFIFTYMIELIINFLLNTLFFLKFVNGNLNFSWCNSLAKNLLIKSWPVCISIIVTSLTLKVDQLIINFLFGKKSLGVYAVSSRIIESSFFIPVIITTSFFPFFCKKFKNIDYYHTACRFYMLVNVVSISCIILIIFLSKYFISYLGESYKYSYQIILVQSFSLLFIFHYSVRKKLFIAENKIKDVLIFSTLILFFLFLSVLFGSMYYGLIGAAYGHLFAWFAVCFLFKKPSFFSTFNPKCFFRI